MDVNSNNINPLYNTADMAVASCDDPNEYAKTDSIVQNWNQHGYSADALENGYDNENNILYYWAHDSNLVYYNNIGYSDTGNGDGWPCYGLLMYTGPELYYRDIIGLQPNYGINGCGMFVGSCNSYEQPWIGAALSNSPTWYIGAIKEVWHDDVGSVSQSFWINLINNHQSLTDALSNAETSNGNHLRGCLEIWPGGIIP